MSILLVIPTAFCDVSPRFLVTQRRTAFCEDGDCLTRRGLELCVVVLVGACVKPTDVINYGSQILIQQNTVAKDTGGVLEKAAVRV